ncbi:hypothetical protein SGL43_05572 [Streptomyces globisporus]|uniref:Uncharacterized protein n=1 Tax=Streptomyces globisporus TaxID=1908 RepID=A0ABM9H4I8_STRGL|nr:hypothetical protein SGL43_05572 [Streptomyces globisporus]
MEAQQLPNAHGPDNRLGRGGDGESGYLGSGSDPERMMR